ncbi:hypothetical protein OIY81_2822 [Cryptosporidium canis]|nr:hypothetical protein OIY81_2822 [Cryptosporidium canis]
MAQFCIHCHNILLLKEHEERMAFYCPTCPYVFKIADQISKVTDFAPKKIEEPSIDMNEIASSKTMGAFPRPAQACRALSASKVFPGGLRLLRPAAVPL